MGSPALQISERAMDAEGLWFAVELATLHSLKASCGQEFWLNTSQPALIRDWNSYIASTSGNIDLKPLTADQNT